MNQILRFLIISVAGLFIFSCSNKQKSSEKDFVENSMNIEVNSNEILFNPNKYQAEDIVFYNIFSPVDLTYLVSKQNAFYNSYLINPINNITKYTSSYKIALNLGVYGADISYLWMFDQSQQALSYKSAIQRLTDKLEIPRDFVDFTYLQAENYQEQFDSLVFIARNSYNRADTYLNNSGRESAAVLILLGGWIETLYIATHMYDNPDRKLLSKIAVQKYSLNSLYNILQKHHDDLILSEYLILLKKLKKTFDELDVHYEAENLVIDTTKKRISLKKGSSFSIEPSDIVKIKEQTRKIREYIIQ